MSNGQRRFLIGGRLAMREWCQVTGRSAALRVLIVLVVIVCGLSVPPGVVFAKAPLGKQWPATQQTSLNDVDPSRFDALLAKYVDKEGDVDYTGWQASKADRQSLNIYLQSLSQASQPRLLLPSQESSGRHDPPHSQVEFNPQLV